MDNANMSYLKYLNEKHQSVFMQNANECLEVQDPALQEPMFTEIDEVSGWTAGGYPILYSSLITEDEQVELDGGVEISELPEKPEEQTEHFMSQSPAVSAPVVSGNGLFVANELLLQLDLHNGNRDVIENMSPTDANINEIKDGDYEPSVEVCSEEQNGQEWNELDVVHMLNNGSVITVDRSVFNNLSASVTDAGKIETTYDKLFETISAYKCKLCRFLCEEQKEIIEHLKSEHVSIQNAACKIKNGSCEHSKPLIKTVEMKSILNVNKNKETKQTVYLCSECNMGYASKNLLKEHMIAKHNLINLSEVHSDSSTEKSASPEVQPKAKSMSEMLINLIMKQYKASRKIKCSIKGCELRFPKDEIRIGHESCHDNGEKKQFKCPHCDQKFLIWRMCSAHLWKCHNIDFGLLCCPKCKYKSASFSRLKVHIMVHDMEHPFMCHECGKSFKQLSQLQNHAVVHKNPEVDDVPEWANQRQCETCKKFFANSKTLKKHVQIVHNKFKPFICNVCGHKTARKSMLDLHLRQHTGEKPHQCPVCVYKTGDPNCLRRHIMRHEGETKYSCPHCDYQSIQSTSYKNHIATKHPGKGGSFYCSVCSYHTVSETAFYSHKREHRINGTSPDCANGQNSPENDCSGATANNQDFEDDETQNCFLNTDFSEDTVDTGGITIPAGYELQVSL